MEFALYGLLALIVLIGLLSALSPVRVAYTEEVTINAPVGNVYDDIRLQEHLMRWSAWPQETKSTCTVEGPDGQIGAKTVFFTKGKRVGYQEVVSLKQDQEVALVLFGPGPPHRPRLTFELRALDDNRTQVLAHFVNDIPRPFNAIWKFAGLSKWTRGMHRKDLAGLKSFSEPPHRDMTGQIVGRPPQGSNPYEHNKRAA
jgi:hypothetical protein